MKKKVIYFLGFLFILLILLLGIKEGFVSSDGCTYKYLRPIERDSDSNMPFKLWNLNTTNKFIKTYNDVNVNLKEEYKMNTSNIIDYAEQFITEKEALYYICQKKFPMNSYINSKRTASMNNKFQEFINSRITKGTYTVKTIPTVLSVRMIYFHIISNSNAFQRRPSIAHKIFNNYDDINKDLPECSNEMSLGYIISTILPRYIPQISPPEDIPDEKYKQIVNMCKKICK